MSFIELNNITKRYKMGDGFFYALDGIDLKIEKGDLVIIKGRSGSGKSTLLNIVGTIDSFEGSYLFNGKEVNGTDDNFRATMRQKQIGFIFQEYYLINHQNVLYNVISPLLFEKGKNLKECKRQALKALARVGMEGFAKRDIDTLSGGQKQRVAIARALVNAPSLILCDEPTGALDSKTASEILKIIENENRSGTTVLFVTHDNSIAFDNAKTIVIADGKILKSSE